MDMQKQKECPMNNSSLLGKMISRNGLILAVFATVCVGLIATTYFITKDTIAGEMKAALARTLNELVDAAQYDNDVNHDCILIPESELLGSSEPLMAYRMRKDSRPVAIILESIAPNGYSGKIKMVVGVFYDGSIAGVRVTDHKETPGLGDKIDISKSDWITSFNGLSLDNTPISQWKVAKDGGQFDAFTGATITPRAVVNQIAKTLEFYQENRSWLFNQQQSCNSKDSK